MYSVDADADAGMLNFMMEHFAMYEEYGGMGRCFDRNVRDRAAIFVARLFLPAFHLELKMAIVVASPTPADELGSLDRIIGGVQMQWRTRGGCTPYEESRR